LVCNKKLYATTYFDFTRNIFVAVLVEQRR
jgi:hypothetical protein